MTGKRKRPSGEPRVKIALEAIRGAPRVAHLATKYASGFLVRRHATHTPRMAREAA
jgi:hypothetical protein